jgi:hypothetical protein
VAEDFPTSPEGKPLAPDLPSAPLLLEYSHRFFGFPGDEHFTGERAGYHWARLCVLGYTQQHEFPAREWVDLGQFKNLKDYPFRSNVLSAFEDGIGGLIESVRGAECTVDPRTGQKFLCVRDLKERMPLWEAFVARHNAEEAAAGGVASRK